MEAMEGVHHVLGLIFQIPQSEWKAELRKVGINFQRVWWISLLIHSY